MQELRCYLLIPSSSSYVNHIRYRRIPYECQNHHTYCQILYVTVMSGLVSRFHINLKRIDSCINLRKMANKRKRSQQQDSDDSDAQSDVESVNAGSSGSDDSSSDDEEVVTSNPNKIAYTNKQRVLIVASRGITARYRHLLEDFKKLIPHHKKDNKLDSKNEIQVINEIAEMKSCNQVLYLETRKHQDLYMYLGKTPHGPSAKFHVVNIHTMDELKLTGNAMIGSRPILNFDQKFEESPHFQVLKVLLNDSFGTPLGHPKSKPFVDRIMSFFIVKNNICK